MIRTVLADSHGLFRAGIASLLRDEKVIDVVGEADDGEAVVELSRKLRPDVVCTEIALPGISGLEAASRILKSVNRTRIIMLTAAWEAPFPMQALRVGACAFITKRCTPDEVVLAIKRAHVGKRFVSADVAERLAFQTFDDAGLTPFDRLSNRELQIALMVVNSQRPGSIAEHLHISTKTVNAYRYRIFDKLDVASDVELAMLAVRHGIVNPMLTGLG